MKNLIFRYIPLFVLIAMCFACKKQNVPTPIVFSQQKLPVSSPEYLANLRAYKQSDHEIAFGWFGGSGVAIHSSYMEDSWEGLPDSMVRTSSGLESY